MFLAMEPLKSPWQYGDFCIIKKPKSIDGHIFKEFLSSFYGVVGLTYLLFIAIVFFFAFPNVILPVLFLLIAKSILHWASLLVWCIFFVDFVSNSFLFWVTYFYPIWVRGGGICFLMLLNEISLCSAFFYPTLPFQRRAIFFTNRYFFSAALFFSILKRN